MKRILAGILLVMVFIGACAFAENEGAFEYRALGDGTAEITGYSGGAEAIIPSEIGGLAVVGIGAHAFSNNARLTRAVVPEGVTYVSYAAFAKCENLVSVELPNSLARVRDYAFFGCAALEGVDMPDNLFEIGGSAFYGCENLAKISIPESVAIISDYTFKNCPKLVITAPDGSYAALFGVAHDIPVEPFDGAYLPAPGIISHSCSASGVKITWSAVERAIGYKVTRRNLADDELNIKTVTICEFADYNAIPGVAYEYTIVAVANGVESRASAPVNALIPLPAPRDVSVDTLDGIKITWDSVDDAEYYRISRVDNANGQTVLSETSECEYRDAQYNYDTEYLYTITAISGAVSSEPSEAISAIVSAPVELTLAAPKAVALDDSEGILLTWEAVERAQNYRVAREDTASGQVIYAETSECVYRDAQFKYDTEYLYTIIAISGAVSSEPSEAISAIVSSPAELTLAAPKSVALDDSEGIVLTWEAVERAQNYRVAREDTASGQVIYAETSECVYRDAQYNYDTEYLYTITAISGAVSSEPSEAISAIISAPAEPALAAPSITVFDAVEGGVHIEWGAVEGAAEYRVTRRDAETGKRVEFIAPDCYYDDAPATGGEYVYSVVAAVGGRVSPASEARDARIEIAVMPESTTPVEYAAESDFVFATLGGVAVITEYRDDAAGGEVRVPAAYIGCPVTEIGESAFYDKAALTSVILPETLETIGDFAFFSCVNLKKVTIPASVTAIGDYAFANCDSLAEVALPESAIYDFESAFMNCPNLKITTYPVDGA